MVDGEQLFLVRRREEIDQLYALEGVLPHSRKNVAFSRQFYFSSISIDSKLSIESRSGWAIRGDAPSR